MNDIMIYEWGVVMYVWELEKKEQEKGHAVEIQARPR